MTSIRFGFFAALLSAALMGCPQPIPNPCTADGGRCTDGGPTDECFEDVDCPDPRFFFCNTTTSMCEPSCRQKNDCTATERGQYALDYCAGNLGCQCDEGKCVAGLCGSDSDCGATSVCRNGACVTAPTAADVDRCVVLPDYAVLKAGSAQKFYVEAFTAAGDAVVLKDGVTWTAGAGGTIVGAGNSATFTAGGAAMAEAVGPTATIGTKSCTARVVTLDGTVGVGEVAVIVTDELTGRGVTGATVIASDVTGATVGTSAMTNASGYAKITGVVGAETAISIFSSSYNYLTIANYDLTGSRVLSAVLRRHQNDKYGGQKGTFRNVPMTSNVHAALSGMSIAGSITDLSLTQLLGNTVPTRVKIGNAIDQMDVPLPAGVYLGFSDQQIKTQVAAQGLAGVCSSAKGGETAIASGSCGTRTGWALAGDVPLGDLPIDAFAGGVDNIKFDVVLARVIPIFRKFNSSVVRDVEFSLKDTPKDGNGAPQFKDAGTEDFTTKDHDFSPPGAVPLAFNFVTRIPDLPKYRNTPVDGVVLLGGATVPGRGVVPLGLGVAVNTDGDLKTDKPMDLSGPGLAQLRMAPTHHGIEGSEYGILALGVSFKSFQDSSAGIATSGIFVRPASNRLVFDPTGASPLDLGAGNNSFPIMPEGAKYNYASAAVGGLTGRTFRIPGFTTTGNAVTTVRVTFTDAFEHRWVVLADPAKVSTVGFTLPAPVAGAVDRTFSNGMASGTRSTLLVQTIRLSENPSASSPSLITYRALVEANNTNADRMTDFTTAFSFIDYARPDLEWKTPAAGGTIMKGTNAVITVKSFKVGTSATNGDDGYVKITFTGGTGCTEASGQSDTSMGKGEINVMIPSTCTGAGITATAKLVDINGMDLNPPVTATQTITVN